jgi:hypothetical protein
MYRKLLEREGFKPTGEPVDTDAWLKPAKSPIQLWSKPIIKSSNPPAIETGEDLAEEPEGFSPGQSVTEPPAAATPASEPGGYPEKAFGIETISAAAQGEQLTFAFPEPMVEANDPIGPELIEPESFIPAIEAGLKTIKPIKIEEQVLSPSDLQPLLQEGIRLFRMGMAGDRQAARAAHEVLQRAHETDSENLDAMAYYASSAFLLCLDMADAGQMLDCAIKGITLLNKVVNRDSGNPHYRMLRAFLFNALPESYFHLTETAIEDFNTAIAAYEQNRSLFPTDVYWQMLRDLGAAYRKVNQEEKANLTLEALKNQCGDPSCLN